MIFLLLRKQETFGLLKVFLVEKVFFQNIKSSAFGFHHFIDFFYYPNLSVVCLGEILFVVCMAHLAAQGSIYC